MSGAKSYLVLLVARGLGSVPGGLLRLLLHLLELVLEVVDLRLEPGPDELQRLYLLPQDLVLPSNWKDSLNWGFLQQYFLIFQGFSVLEHILCGQFSIIH